MAAGTGRTTLLINNYIQSTNKCFQVILQSDGNLVLYRQSDKKALWGSMTYGNTAKTTVMQSDGNLVVYDSNNHPEWNSRTYGNPGAFLILQDDGNLVIFSVLGKVLWASNTSGGC
jgi:hypothetical protein